MKRDITREITRDISRDSINIYVELHRPRPAEMPVKLFPSRKITAIILFEFSQQLQQVISVQPAWISPPLKAVVA